MPHFKDAALSCTDTRQASFGLALPAVLAASVFLGAAVMTGYIWKSEKSHKAEPQSAQRRDMLRQRYERLALFEEKTALSCRECCEMLGVCSLGDGKRQKEFQHVVITPSFKIIMQESQCY